MTLFKAIGVEINSEGKSQGRGQSSSSIHNCKYCGKSHNKGNCPAFGKKCQKCGKDNHFKAVCKSDKM